MEWVFLYSFRSDLEHYKILHDKLLSRTQKPYLLSWKEEKRPDQEGPRKISDISQRAKSAPRSLCKGEAKNLLKGKFVKL